MKVLEFPHGEVRFTDCVAGMEEIPDKSIDLIVTDPPYGVDKNGCEWDKELNEKWLAQATRISDAVVFTCGIRNLYDYPRPKWVIGWGKPASTSRNDAGGFNNWEPLLYYGSKKLNNDFVNLVFGSNLLSFTPVHPCPKPVNLWKWVLRMFKPARVLDPFVGSGVTPEACEALGVEYLGFELNEEYTGDIEHRAALGIKTFEARQRDGKQKALF